MPYTRERECFRLFRERLQEDLELKHQLECAVKEISDRYDTKIRENRFVVGGVIEHIVGAALRACGVMVRHRGQTATGIDLMFEDGNGGYSVKSMFRANSTRLVNVMGRPAELGDWRTGTLFLVHRGIVYADPDLPWWQENSDGCIRAAGDALQVSKRCVEQFAHDVPEWLVECNLPDRRESLLRATVASADLASQVLRHYRRLFDELPRLVSDI